MSEEALEFHSAAFGYGEVAGGDDQCAVAANRGYYVGVGQSSQ